MTIAQKENLTAIVEVLYFAILRARFCSLEAQKQSEKEKDEFLLEIHDILDSIHNVPRLMINDNKWNEDIFKMFIKEYDKKWTKKSNISLSKIYKQSISF